MEIKEHEYNKVFYKGLHAVTGFAFPQECPKYELRFKSVEQFIERTSPVKDLQDCFESYDPQHRHIIEIIRRCPCGKVILEEFFTRREDTTEGIEHRAEFSHFLKELCAAGVSESAVRSELMKVSKGRPSSLIHRFGIEFTVLG